MKFIDTHTHLYLPEFDADRAIAIADAIKAGVKCMLLPAIDKENFERLISTSINFADVCHPMIGLHPTSVNNTYKEELFFVENMLEKHKFVAIGEVGIDLYWDKTFLAEQIIAFEQQIVWAIKSKLPIVIHARNSFEQIFEVLNKFKSYTIKGVFHCFSGNIQQAKKVIDLGFVLGIGGVLTYKNSGLQKVVEFAGIDNIVLETDAPFLTPVPHRGKRNEPKYIPDIAEKTAQILNIPIDEIAVKTNANASKIFNIELKND